MYIYDIKNYWLRLLIVILYAPFILINNILVYVIISVFNTIKLTIKPLLNGKKPTHKEIVGKIIL